MRIGNSRRTVLSRACFCSPIGHSCQEAVRHLRGGLSGISSLEGFFGEGGPPPFLVTGAVIRPGAGDKDLREFHPRISERFTRVLGNFCGQLREMVGENPVDKLFLICKKPFYSKWREPRYPRRPSGEGDSACDDFDEQTFVSRILECAGLTIHARDICLLHAACSSGLIALNLAIRELEHHPHQTILLIAIEGELHHERYLAIRKLGALSPEKDPRRACQPFSKIRTGLVPGEVAVAALLQSKPLDGLDQSDILLTAGHSNSDAYRLTDGLESGEFLQECLARTFTGDTNDLDFVCPHGTSTPLNDPIEGQVLERFFASRARPIPVVPLKQYLGHTLNSSGLWETVLCAELIRHNFLPPLLNLDEQESYQHLQFERECRETPLSKALKVAIGFGGINAALLIEKAQGR